MPLGSDGGDRAIVAQLMTSEYGWLPVQPRAPTPPVVSVAVTVNGKVPAVVGVPESSPVEAFRTSPGGRPPAVTA